MFGDEPYGNYNRILLSGVLAGSHDAEDIFINPLDWYASTTASRCTPACRVDARSTATRQRVYAGRAIARAVRRRSSSPPGSSPSSRRSRASAAATDELKDGVFVFRTLDDCAAIIVRARDAIARAPR